MKRLKIGIDNNLVPKIAITGINILVGTVFVAIPGLVVTFFALQLTQQVYL